MENKQRTIYGGYIIAQEAYYADALRDDTPEINITWNDEPVWDDGVIAECMIRWYDMGEGEMPAARLEAYCDAWKVLAECTDLLAVLASFDGQRPTVQEVCAALDSIGYTDRTPRERGD